MNNLPGAIHPVYPEDRCENHPDRLAVINLQGETDSFGCELHPMCQECYTAYLAEPKQKLVGQCDWCHSQNVELAATRDYDEGSSGPVYYICKACSRKQQEQILKEYNEMVEEDAREVQQMAEDWIEDPITDDDLEDLRR